MPYDARPSISLQAADHEALPPCGRDSCRARRGRSRRRCCPSSTLRVSSWNGWLLKPDGAAVDEEHAAQPAEHADRREHRLDEREPQFDVGEKALLADELQILVAPHLRVAAEVEESRDCGPSSSSRGCASPARRWPSAARSSARRRRRSGARSSSSRSWAIRCTRLHRLARHRPVVAKHRRLVHERHAERHHAAVAEERLADTAPSDIARPGPAARCSCSTRSGGGSPSTPPCASSG